MKSLSAAVQAVLDRRLGVEPVNILAVQWVKDGAMYYYADKEITGTVVGETAERTIPGAILEVGTLESIVKLDSQGQSQAISLKISDIDGEIKDIIDNHDIHARPAKIYQWFDNADLPLNEMFVLFEGQIASNIVWSEGDRTVTLDIITAASLSEAGFSAEESLYTNVPESLIGQAWPLCFGTVVNVKALALTNVPQGSLATGDGLTDPTLFENYTAGENNKDALFAAAFVAIMAAGTAAMTAMEYSTGSPKWSEFKSYQHSYEQQAASLMSQYAQQDSDNQALLMEYMRQQGFDKDELVVDNGHLFPQNKDVTLEIEGVRYTGEFQNDRFIIRTKELINFSGDTSTAIGFTWNGVGNTVNIVSGHKIAYIANLIPSTIKAVRAFYKGSDKKSVLTTVPREWYQIKVVNIFGYRVTVIVLDKPLSGHDKNFENELYITLKSSVGPDVVNIMKWLIDTYTDLEYDTESFNYVQSCISKYTCHFALNERIGIIELLEDLAYQSRCAIWLSDRKFHLKYLSKEYTPVATITDSDIEAGSLILTTTPTEELTTRYVATWQDNYVREINNKIVLRHNIGKYGLFEKEHHYFSYNNYYFVHKSALYWSIRSASIWKVVKFTTYVHKLALETFDTITLDFEHNIVSTEPVDGIITNLTYDSAEKTLQVEVWVPIRMGEMQEYGLAFPADLSTDIMFSPITDIYNEYTFTVGNMTDLQELRNEMTITTQSSDWQAFWPEWVLPYVDWEPWGGPITPMTVIPLPLAKSYYPEYFPSDETPLPQVAGWAPLEPTPENFEKSPYGPYTLMPFVPYDNQFKLLPFEMFSGTVISGSGDSYLCDVYTSGPDNDPEALDVRQLQIDPAETIPPGTLVIVLRIPIWTTNDDYTLQLVGYDYIMQVPVWL